MSYNSNSLCVMGVGGDKYKRKMKFFLFSKRKKLNWPLSLALQFFLLN